MLNPARDWKKAEPLAAHRLAAAASPAIPIRELTGSFSDVEDLLEQLGEPAVIELGKPLPQEKYLPRKRAGRCHAAHNDALLDG